MAVAQGKRYVNCYIGHGVMYEPKRYTPGLPTPLMAEWAPPTEEEEGAVVLVEQPDVKVHHTPHSNSNTHITSSIIHHHSFHTSHRIINHNTHTRHHHTYLTSHYYTLPSTSIITNHSYSLFHTFQHAICDRWTPPLPSRKGKRRRRKNKRPQPHEEVCLCLGLSTVDLRNHDECPVIDLYGRDQQTVEKY